jgi:hypothetical protein
MSETDHDDDEFDPQHPCCAIHLLQWQREQREMYRASSKVAIRQFFDSLNHEQLNSLSMILNAISGHQEPRQIAAYFEGMVDMLLDERFERPKAEDELNAILRGEPHDGT